MKLTITRALFGLGVVLLATSASAQSTIDNTTISGAMTATQTTVTVVSATCTGCTVANGTVVYVDAEAMRVISVTATSTIFNVTRGTDGTAASAHNTGAVAWIGPGNRFHASDPVPLGNFVGTGACTQASYGGFKPWISFRSGLRWFCDNINWDPSSGGSTTLPFVIRTTQRLS